jgi:hypothetical protein
LLDAISSHVALVGRREILSVWDNWDTNRPELAPTAPTDCQSQQILLPGLSNLIISQIVRHSDIRIK